VALQPSGEFRAPAARWRAIAGEAPEEADQVVEADRARPQEIDDATRVSLGIGLEIQRFAILLARAQTQSAASMIGVTALMDVGGLGHQRRGPCLIRSLVPAARGSSGEPGTANTFAALFRPPSRAVISEPETVCGLDDDDGRAPLPRSAGCALGKSRARGHMSLRPFRRSRRPLFEQRSQQIPMFGGG